MTRITCGCCKRKVSPSRWNDDADVCSYCMWCLIGGPCTRGQSHGMPASDVPYNAAYQYAAGYHD
jgi:hypothetical protein